MNVITLVVTRPAKATFNFYYFFLQC